MKQILKRAVAALLAAGMAFGSLPVLSEEMPEPEQGAALLVIIEKKNEAAPAQKVPAAAEASFPESESAETADQGGTPAASISGAEAAITAPAEQAAPENETEPNTEATPATETATVSATEPTEEVEPSAEPATDPFVAEPTLPELGAETSETPVTAPAEQAAPAIETELNEEAAATNETATVSATEPTEEVEPSAEPATDPFVAEPTLPGSGAEASETPVTDPAEEAVPANETEPNTEATPANEAATVPTTETEATEEVKPSAESATDPFGTEPTLPELGAEASEASVTDPVEEAAPSEPLSETEAAIPGAEPAQPVEEALAAKAQGAVTSYSLETVNGFTTLRFTIDWRYEGTICGLTPSTTDAEAYAIARGAAAQLFTSGGDFSVADADRYTGFTDRKGAFYGEQQTLLQKAEEALAVTTDPAERARLIAERNAALEQLARYSGNAELQRMYENWHRDQDDPDLRRALDDRIALEIEETRRAYEASRGYEQMNAVFGGQSPIDAEKNSFVNYYLSEAEQDSAMCWAASAADMLWYSGWGAQAVNPLTGANFADEDELFAWLRTAFDNSGAKQNTGIQYLFKGITPDAFNLGYAQPRSGYYDPNDPYALLAQYAADLLVSFKESTNDPSGIASMLGALNDGSAVGLSVYSPNYTSGHAVTAFGQIVDTLAADPAAALRAVFIADSDGDVPRLAEEDYNGGLLKDGQQDPAGRMNAYRMLKTGVYTDPYTGDSAIRLDDYNGWLLAGVTVLAPCTEENRQGVTETDPDATLNAANTPDLIPTDIGVVSKNASGTLEDIYKEGEPLMAVLRIKDESGVALPGNRDIPVEMQLYRLDKKTGEVTELVETFDFTWDHAIAANKKSTETWDIGDALEPGVYRLDLGGLNADHTVTEAYYINNINVDGYVFTIVAIPVSRPGRAEERRGTFAVYPVYATVLDPSEPAPVAFLTPDGQGGVRSFGVNTSGAVLRYMGKVVEKDLWSVSHGADGLLELRLDPDYLTGLGTGEHVFTLECKDARVIFYVTVAPPLA